MSLVLVYGDNGIDSDVVNQQNAGIRQQTAKVPRHIGILMDGNGRWAIERGLPRPMGHRAATENVFPILDFCAELGVEVVTLYVFSTENWKRPSDEVIGFLALMGEMLDRFTAKLYVRGYRFWFSGSFEGVSDELRGKFYHALELTKDNKGLIVNVAFNYGGRDEIMRATRKIVERGLEAEDIDERVFESFLDTAGLPDMDLVIRTSGEQRLSNFCLWQSVDAVFYTTPVLWPDFTVHSLKTAVDVFGQARTRGSEPRGVMDFLSQNSSTHHYFAWPQKQSSSKTAKGMGNGAALCDSLWRVKKRNAVDAHGNVHYNSFVCRLQVFRSNRGWFIWTRSSLAWLGPPFTAIRPIIRTRAMWVALRRRFFYSPIPFRQPNRMTFAEPEGHGMV